MCLTLTTWQKYTYCATNTQDMNLQHQAQYAYPLCAETQKHKPNCMTAYDGLPKYLQVSRRACPEHTSSTTQPQYDHELPDLPQQ